MSDTHCVEKTWLPEKHSDSKPVPHDEENETLPYDFIPKNHAENSKNIYSL